MNYTKKSRKHLLQLLIRISTFFYFLVIFASCNEDEFSAENRLHVYILDEDMFVYWSQEQDVDNKAFINYEERRSQNQEIYLEFDPEREDWIYSFFCSSKLTEELNGAKYVSSGFVNQIVKYESLALNPRADSVVVDVKGRMLEIEFSQIKGTVLDDQVDKWSLLYNGIPDTTLAATVFGAPFAHPPGKKEHFVEVIAGQFEPEQMYFLYEQNDPPEFFIRYYDVNGDVIAENGPGQIGDVSPPIFGNGRNIRDKIRIKFTNIE